MSQRPRTAHEEAMEDWFRGGSQGPQPKEEDYPDTDIPGPPISTDSEEPKYENPFGSEEGVQSPTDAGVHAMIERDKGDWLNNLRTHASKLTIQAMTQAATTVEETSRATAEETSRATWGRC